MNDQRSDYISRSRLTCEEERKRQGITPETDLQLIWTFKKSSGAGVKNCQDKNQKILCRPTWHCSNGWMCSIRFNQKITQPLCDSRIAYPKVYNVFSIGIEVKRSNSSVIKTN
tara:strand:- start:148 stop:486 length:339 start_codon:yes stop_codon:yes gene_type:complete